MAWLTTRIDRRFLLVVTLAAVALGQGASALAPNYAVILIVRLAMRGRRNLHAASGCDGRPHSAGESQAEPSRSCFSAGRSPSSAGFR
jgi:MFS family permease